MEAESAAAERVTAEGELVILFLSLFPERVSDQSSPRPLVSPSGPSSVNDREVCGRGGGGESGSGRGGGEVSR